jgi:hypothetical protein
MLTRSGVQRLRKGNDSDNSSRDVASTYGDSPCATSKDGPPQLAAAFDGHSLGANEL